MRRLSLDDLVKSKRPFTDRQLYLVEKWLDADWESHDVDENLIKLIRRLLATVEEKAILERRAWLSK